MKGREGMGQVTDALAEVMLCALHHRNSPQSQLSASVTHRRRRTAQGTVGKATNRWAHAHGPAFRASIAHQKMPAGCACHAQTHHLARCIRVQEVLGVQWLASGSAGRATLWKRLDADLAGLGRTCW